MCLRLSEAEQDAEETQNLPCHTCHLCGPRDFSDEDVDFGFPKFSVSETDHFQQLRLHVDLLMTLLLCF